MLLLLLLWCWITHVTDLQFLQVRKWKHYAFILKIVHKFTTVNRKTWKREGILLGHPPPIVCMPWKFCSWAHKCCRLHCWVCWKVDGLDPAASRTWLGSGCLCKFRKGLNYAHIQVHNLNLGYNLKRFTGSNVDTHLKGLVSAAVSLRPPLHCKAQSALIGQLDQYVVISQTLQAHKGKVFSTLALPGFSRERI